ncbi:hypothetical protein NQ315_013503 [Exocentrus adspersus]|uniref:Uncharacterized protein n=1 Tax=Exocentrus adspersus TaxID=1586481 RepID=A0AAV8V8P3_9CUCU|nr:hypothetical protein NQ315_013503 [Exocentrus adspersus]
MSYGSRPLAARIKEYEYWNLGYERPIELLLGADVAGRLYNTCRNCNGNVFWLDANGENFLFCCEKLSTQIMINEDGR